MLKATMVLAVIGVVTQVISLPPYLAALSAGPAAAQESARLLMGASPVLVLSQGLAVIGGIIFTLLAFRAYSEEGSPVTAQWLNGALALVILAHVAGRYLFYTTGVKIMVGYF